MIHDRRERRGAAIVEVRCMLLQTAQRCRSILSGGRPLCVCRILAHTCWVVEEGRRRVFAAAEDVLEHVGHRWSLVARRASRLITEHILAAFGSIGVEGSWRRFWSAKTQLICKKRRQLWRHEIRRVADGQANP